MKLAILEITPETIMKLLKNLMPGQNEKYQIIKNGLPEDVDLIDVGAFSNVDIAEDKYATTLRFKLHSDTFEDIHQGDILPILPHVVIETIHINKSEMDVLGSFEFLPAGMSIGRTDRAEKIIRELLKAINETTYIDEQSKRRQSYYAPTEDLLDLDEAINTAEEYLKEIEGGK